MANRYGLGLDKLVEEDKYDWGRGATLSGPLTGFQAGANMMRSFLTERADRAATDAAKEASQVQTRGGEDNTPIDKSVYGRNEDGSYQLTPGQQRAVEESGDFVLNGGEVTPSYGKDQYGLGKNPASYRDTPYTPAEIRAAGTAAKAQYYGANYSPGSAAKAEQYGEMMERDVDRGMQRDLTRGQIALLPTQKLAAEQGAALMGVQLDSARGAAKEREQFRDIANEYTTARTAADKGDYGPLQKLVARDYNGQVRGLDDGSSVRFLADGNVALMDKAGNGTVLPLTPEFAGKMVDYGMERRLGAISPELYDQFKKRQGEAEGRRDSRDYQQGSLDVQRKAAQNTRDYQRETFELQKLHLGAQSSAAERSYNLAKDAHKLNIERHGADSPEAKRAKLILDREQGYQDGLTSMAKLIESGATPREVTEAARKTALAGGTDKMVPLKRKTADGMEEQFLASPLDARAQAYTTQYAARERERLDGKYPGVPGIEVTVSANGVVGYRSSRTPGATRYASEAEMVKADKIQGLVRDPNAPAPSPAAQSGGRPLPPAASRTPSEQRLAESEAFSQDRANLRALNQGVRDEFTADVSQLTGQQLLQKYRNRRDVLSMEQTARMDALAGNPPQYGLGR